MQKTDNLKERKGNGHKGLAYSQTLADQLLTHHEVLPVRAREHVSHGERPPGDVCNGRGRVRKVTGSYRVCQEHTNLFGSRE
eukprot:1142960-Pelagomonas_calceolata.AAC.6